MNALSGQNGFSLLEMVIAMGLFAIGLMGLALMTSGLMSNNATARNRADATRLSQNKLEALGSGAYSEIGYSLETDIDALGISGNGVFQREVAVAEKSGPVRKEVTVTVSWEGEGTHRVVLKAVFAP